MRRRGSGRPELYVRIGLNSGPAVVGNMGSEQRFDYTMLGEIVGTHAELLEDLTFQMKLFSNQNNIHFD